MKQRFCRATIACLFALTSAGTTFAQIDAALAARILGRSGTLAQIDAVTPQFRGNFEQGLREQRDEPLTRDETAKLTAMADRVFAPAALRASIVATAAERLTAEHVAALETWYDSALGKRFMVLEEAASKADGAAAMQAGAAIVAKLPAQRAAQLKALVEATRAAEFVADLSIDMAVAAAYTTSIATSRNETPAIKDLRESAMKDRSQVVQAMNNILLNAYAKTYEKVDDEGLKTYAEFMRSAAGKQFTETIIVAFNRAIMGSATALGKAIVDSRKPAKK
jgi:Uncharacterized protein conserved in bacteria (DUF2059)